MYSYGEWRHKNLGSLGVRFVLGSNLDMVMVIRILEGPLFL